MNKKGVIASYMVDFYAYLAFAIILVVFFLSVTFFGSSIDEKLPSEVATADITMMLSKILQAKTNSGLTVAEIISNNREDLSEGYKTAVSDAIKKVLPSKQDVADAVLVVYKKELATKDFCGGVQTKFLFLPEKFGVGDYSTIPASDIRKEIKIVYGFVNIPFVSGDDYVSAALCVHRKWFDE